MPQSLKKIYCKDLHDFNIWEIASACPRETLILLSLCNSIFCTPLVIELTRISSLLFHSLQWFSSNCCKLVFVKMDSDSLMICSMVNWFSIISRVVYSQSTSVSSATTSSIRASVTEYSLIDSLRWLLWAQYFLWMEVCILTWRFNWP